MQAAKTTTTWAGYVDRYKAGEWRARIYRDLILAEIASRGAGKVANVLDVGCGMGFDDDKRAQKLIADVSGQYVGIEPDEAVELQPVFTTVHRCLLEDAPLVTNYFDVAFSVMVLEHVAQPEQHWRKLWEVLKPGGVFWGFTVDSRHWFSMASSVVGVLGLKDMYLNALHGKKGQERYENYPTQYRTNTPGKMKRWAKEFTSVECINLARPDQMDFYFPSALRPVTRTVERLRAAASRPGLLLCVRAVK